MTRNEQIAAALIDWQKSSRSAQSGNCIEVAVLEPEKQ